MATKEKSEIRPKKSLGQNFLIQLGIIKKLVSAAQIKNGEIILEIGPGTGNLTEELLKTGSKIIAIEKDREMISLLENRFKDNPNLVIQYGDALGFDEIKIKSPYKIAANLPFYLTAPLIRKFLESKNPPISLMLVVQKEVAQRICAQTPKMNLLAVSVQIYSKVKIIDYVSKGCFWPAPKVDCAILQITPFPKIGELADKKFIDLFFKIVKAGFMHPRKQITSNLAKELKINKENTFGWLTKNNIKPNQRAETLSVENWISLAQSFQL